MSTQSTIWKINANGTAKGIGCNFDGDVDGVGLTLLNHYQDADKVDELLELGEISSLGASPKVAPELAEFGTKAFDKNYSTEVSSGYTLAYHRDRGEELNIYNLEDINNFFKANADDVMHELIFIYKDNQWYVTNNTVNFILVPLTIEEINKVVYDLDEDGYRVSNI